MRSCKRLVSAISLNGVSAFSGSGRRKERRGGKSDRETGKTKKDEEDGTDKKQKKGNRRRSGEEEERVQVDYKSMLASVQMAACTYTKGTLITKGRGHVTL